MWNIRYRLRAVIMGLHLMYCTGWLVFSVLRNRGNLYLSHGCGKSIFSEKGIHETTKYLEMFLRNLLLNEKIELHNLP